MKLYTIQDLNSKYSVPERTLKSRAIALGLRKKAGRWIFSEDQVLRLIDPSVWNTGKRPKNKKPKDLKGDFMSNVLLKIDSEIIDCDIILTNVSKNGINVVVDLKALELGTILREIKSGKDPEREFKIEGKWLEGESSIGGHVICSGCRIKSIDPLFSDKGEITDKLAFTFTYETMDNVSDMEGKND